MLLVGSQNPHKLREIRALLEDVGIEVVGSEAVSAEGDVVEDGETFSQNVAIKVLEYARRAAGLDRSERPRWVIADDSGLCVDALGGAPGVYSSRYAGQDGNYAANNRKLLTELRGLPAAKRRAHFVCTISCAAVPRAASETPTVLFEVEGRCEGVIADEERGRKGFGYDPLFIEPTTQKTFAELSAEEKNRLSHRGGRPPTVSR